MQSDDSIDPAILNLSAEEKRAFGYLFNQADTDQLGVITGERAVPFFERTGVSPNVLGEIWQIADTENRGLLTRPGFCIVVRLIGHYQAGREPSTELAFKPAPVPKFEGLTIPGAGGPASPTGGAFPPNALQPQLSGQGPIRVPPLDPQKVQQYSGLFEKSGAQNGMLEGGTAKAIFERAGLPNETLGRIWMLSDREQRGGLDQTEFIVAMHLLTSMKTRAMTALPNTLPQGFWDAAARRGAPLPPGSRQGPGPNAIPRQFTGNSASGSQRAQSPLSRPPGYGIPPTQVPQTTGPQWLITAQEKGKYDQFFSTVDTQGRGVVTGEQAVRFFSDSGLPEETLASIWDLADINSEGQLNKDEFAVAMYLIRQQRAPNAAPLPAFLPPALVPPSMRKQNLQQQTQQTTAPAFDNAANANTIPKSAADDLFGLDEPSPPSQQPVLQPQGTGASASRDPFNSSSVPASPSSPQRFQPPQQQGGTMFKPFMPTSAFGASLAQQNTGGSATSSQRGFPPAQQQKAAQPAAMDDLLGDNETHAEESSKLNNDTTELANMSNQIGNLRSQMEQTQAKKSTTQADLNASAAQKKELESRLQQFRAQYEQEVRTVKELEQQLAASKDSTKKLGQELALLEGGYQDLQTQHQTVGQALQADQTENANLKQRISQLNAEVARMKPEIEKMKLDARQQKGMVSINKKQLATNEGERDRLQAEKADLDREASERAGTAARSPPPEARGEVTSPAGSTMSSTNPFFRKTGAEAPLERSTSPATAMSGAPTPSAFDQLFGPSFHQPGSRSATPPATSFVGRPTPVAAPHMTDSVSSEGRPTPSATPPISDREITSPQTTEPPPPPENRQFLPSELPVGGLRPHPESVASSTQVMPPASRAGGVETPKEFESPGGPGGLPSSAEPVPGSFPSEQTTPAVEEEVPGAFPAEHAQPHTAAKEVGTPSTAAGTPAVAPKGASDDFDSAFAGFGAGEKALEGEDPFGQSAQSQPQARGFGSEFPPIQNLENDNDSDSESDSDRGFGDNFAATAPTAENGAPAPQEAEKSASLPAVASGSDLAAARPNMVSNESTASNLPGASAQPSPPSYEQSDSAAHGGSGERSGSNQFPAEYGGLLPAREDPTSPPPPVEEPPPGEETQKSLQTPQTSNFPTITTPGSTLGTSTSETFHDAFSRPVSSVVDNGAAPAKPQPGPASGQKNDFDDFDDFEDLAEAKEADKTGSDFDFGFGGGHTRDNSEFDSAFDSPAASMTTTMADSQQTPTQGQSTSSFSGFGSNVPAFGSGGSSSVQQTPQNGQHDWDAIFSGLDNSATGNIDTSFGNSAANSDPWATNTNGAAEAPKAASPVSERTIQPPAPSAGQSLGRAVTPGTEHDDPILKRLTGMGYPRGEALNALEMYDYDINKVSWDCGDTEMVKGLDR